MSNLPQIDIDKEKIEKAFSSFSSVFQKKQTQIETKEFIVKGNIVALNDNIIPINNISMITITPKPRLAKLRYLFISFCFFYWSIKLMILNDGWVTRLQQEIANTGIGIAIFFLLFFCLLKYIDKIKKVAEGGNLNFSLNSGKIYSLVFEDTKFLKSVHEVLSTIIADSAFNGVYHFDISDCTIDNSTYERKNYISNTQIDQIVNKNRIDHNVFESDANVRQG